MKIIAFSLYRIFGTYCHRIPEFTIKKNKILSTEIIERQRHLIIDCRGIIYVHQSERFQKEIQVAFLGDHSISEWKETGISQLQNSCHYLMVNRGFECWET